MRPRVYIETTVPSYYCETRTTPQATAWRQATRAWWPRAVREYELYTSRAVLVELGRAPARKARATLRLVRTLPLLDEPPVVDSVAAFCIENGAMPTGARGDAYHLALASFHNLDCLVTWNCRHLANAAKQRHLEVLNARLGLRLPILTTPLTLLPEDAR